MNENGDKLKQVTEDLFPYLISKFKWADVWNAPVTTGTAFEWTIFAAILATLKDNGWDITFPILDVSKGEELFISRNEIPFQHGAQAGHSANNLSNTSLKENFIQSLVPKAVIKKGTEIYSIFREGFPYHRIMGNLSYNDRPDIIIVPGEPTEGYPLFIPDRLELNFSYDTPINVSGVLRVVNSTIIPCRKRSPRMGFNLPVKGIIECSINKSAKVAELQLEKYCGIFAISEDQCTLITGNMIYTDFNYIKSHVDIKNDDLLKVKTDCLVAAKLTLKAFDLI